MGDTLNIFIAGSNPVMGIFLLFLYYFYYVNTEKLIFSIIKQAQCQKSWTWIPSQYPEKNETDEAKDNVDKNLRVPHWDQVGIFLDKEDEDEKDESIMFNPIIDDPATKEYRKDYGRFQNI